MRATGLRARLGDELLQLSKESVGAHRRGRSAARIDERLELVNQRPRSSLLVWKRESRHAPNDGGADEQRKNSDRAAFSSRRDRHQGSSNASHQPRAHEDGTEERDPSPYVRVIADPPNRPFHWEGCLNLKPTQSKPGAKQTFAWAREPKLAIGGFDYPIGWQHASRIPNDAVLIQYNQADSKHPPAESPHSNRLRDAKEA